jgi:hypothetical protein
MNAWNGVDVHMIYIGAENKSYSVGIDGKEVKFKKPWTQTAFMFLGEMTALLYYYLDKYYHERKARLAAGGKVATPISDHTTSATRNGTHTNGGVADGQMPLLAATDGVNGTEVAKPPAAPFYLFLPPAFLDLFGITYTLLRARVASQCNRMVD